MYVVKGICYQNNLYFTWDRREESNTLCLNSRYLSSLFGKSICLLAGVMDSIPTSFGKTYFSTWFVTDTSLWMITVCLFISKECIWKIFIYSSKTDSSPNFRYRDTSIVEWSCATLIWQCLCLSINSHHGLNPWLSLSLIMVELQMTTPAVFNGNFLS